MTKTTKSGKKGLLWAVLLAAGGIFLAASCRQAPGKPAESDKGGVPVQLSAIRTSRGWGYEIQINHKTYIHQEFVPAIPGRQGFTSKEEALLVGKKVVEKILNGQMPPTLSIPELQQMGVTAAMTVSLPAPHPGQPPGR